MLQIRSIQIVDEIEDIENGFVDVVVCDVTGYGYTMVVTTPTALLKAYGR